MKKFGVFFCGIFALIMVQLSFAQDYVVSEGDLLHITVYDQPDLTTDARIGDAGTILFPLIGQVKVVGLSVPQVAGKLQGLLADGYIISPQVTVAVAEFRSQKATIMGEVNKPGMYDLKGSTTLLQLLSNAGDLTKDAGDKALIRRKADPGGKEDSTISIDLKRLIKMGDLSLDIPIMDGDSIYVNKAGFFYINGEVKSPNEYKFEEGLTVLKAITMAGGFTGKASEGRVRIIRHIAGKEKVLENVKMHDSVLADDVIVVPESLF